MAEVEYGTDNLLDYKAPGVVSTTAWNQRRRAGPIGLDHPARYGRKKGPTGSHHRKVWLELVKPRPEQTFVIDDDAEMPTIDAEVKVHGIDPDPTPATEFLWKIEISFDSSRCNIQSGGVFITQKRT